MMIDRVYQTVKMLGNSEVRGNFKPADFDKAVYNVILEKFEEYPFELNRALNRQNRGLIGGGLENIPDNILEKMQHFSKEATLVYASPSFTIPSDARDIDAVIHLDKNEIVLAKNTSQFNHIKNFKHIAPTIDCPIGLRIGNQIKVLPSSIVADVKLYYLRNPLIPKWTYVVDPISEAEMFNPSAGDFQDIDMHPSEEDDIVSRICIKMGINLKEADLQISATNSETQEFNQQNSN
ncbi:MAG: hypothetical protein H7Y10_03670 [Flavobacterium sp.]|nr:hypothetical protein [Flavobacterium sp.]